MASHTNIANGKLNELHSKDGAGGRRGGCSAGVVYQLEKGRPKTRWRHGGRNEGGRRAPPGRCSRRGGSVVLLALYPVVSALGNVGIFGYILQARIRF